MSWFSVIANGWYREELKNSTPPVNKNLFYLLFCLSLFFPYSFFFFCINYFSVMYYLDLLITIWEVHKLKSHTDLSEVNERKLFTQLYGSEFCHSALNMKWDLPAYLHFTFPLAALHFRYNICTYKHENRFIPWKIMSKIKFYFSRERIIFNFIVIAVSPWGLKHLSNALNQVRVL